MTYVARICAGTSVVAGAPRFRHPPCCVQKTPGSSTWAPQLDISAPFRISSAFARISPRLPQWRRARRLTDNSDRHPRQNWRDAPGVRGGREPAPLRRRPDHCPPPRSVELLSTRRLGSWRLSAPPTSACSRQVAACQSMPALLLLRVLRSSVAAGSRKCCEDRMRHGASGVRVLMN